MSDIIFSTSYVVFPTSNIVLGVFGKWKLFFCFAPFVGAYCIRPVRHRISRIANRYCDIANPRILGRMPYAHTAA